MPLDCVIINRADGKDLLTVPSPGDRGPILISQTVGQALGVFRSISETTAGTFSIASILTGQSIVVTDILLSSKKKASSSLTLRFSDGTNTVNIFSPDTVSGEVNFSASLAGLFSGWAGADLEIVTVADVVFTATIGFYKFTGGDDFSVWDAKR